MVHEEHLRPTRGIGLQVESPPRGCAARGQLFPSVLFVGRASAFDGHV